MGHFRVSKIVIMERIIWTHQQFFCLNYVLCFFLVNTSSKQWVFYKELVWNLVIVKDCLGWPTVLISDYLTWKTLLIHWSIVYHLKKNSHTNKQWVFYKKLIWNLVIVRDCLGWLTVWKSYYSTWKTLSNNTLKCQLTP